MNLASITMVRIRSVVYLNKNVLTYTFVQESHAIGRARKEAPAWSALSKFKRVVRSGQKTKSRQQGHLHSGEVGLQKIASFRVADQVTQGRKVCPAYS
jgi:hypothetical protein